MNLDELKTTWQIYDHKLTATKQLNEKLIKNIIREKSGNTLSKMRRNCLLIILWMAIVIAFCFLVIISNPFDYQYHFQYISFIIFIFVGTIYIIQLIKEYHNSNVDLFNNSLKDSLMKTLQVHEKLMSSYKKVPMLFLLASFLYLISSSIKAFQNEGIINALVFLTAGILINGLIFFIALKLGAFKDHFGIKLKNQLKELEEFEEEGLKL